MKYNNIHHTITMQWGHVTYVTIALNNGKLLKLLSEKRVLERLISMECPVDIERRINRQRQLLPPLMLRLRRYFMPNLRKLDVKLRNLEGKVSKLLTKT